MEDVDLSRLGDFEIRLSLGGKRNDAMFLELWEVMCYSFTLLKTRCVMKPYCHALLCETLVI